MGVTAQLQLPHRPARGWRRAGQQDPPRGTDAASPRLSAGRSGVDSPPRPPPPSWPPLPPPAPAAATPRHKAPQPQLSGRPRRRRQIFQPLIGRWPWRLPGNAVRGWERQGPKGRGSSACGEEERGWGGGGAENASRPAGLDEK